MSYTVSTFCFRSGFVANGFEKIPGDGLQNKMFKASSSCHWLGLYSDGTSHGFRKSIIKTNSCYVIGVLRALEMRGLVAKRAIPKM